jgi:formate hydrogenlyase transcriptional activator
MASSLASFQPDNPIPVTFPEGISEPEKLLSAYFNSAHVGLCILDSEFRYLAINQKLAEMNGLPVAAHLGKTLRVIIGDVADPVESRIRQVLSNKQPMDQEVSGKVPAKSEIGHWTVHYVPLADEAGNVTRIGVLVVEITAQKELEKSLRQETARLQMLMELSTLLSSNSKLDQVFPQISARIRRVLRQEFASFTLHDPITGLLIRHALDFPLGKGITQAVPITLGPSPAGVALQQREAMIFSQKQMETFDSAISKSYVAEGLKSLCCVPLLRPKTSLGVLVLGSTRKHAFHADDLHILNQLAAQLGIALENQRAAAEIETLKTRLTAEKKFLEGEVRSDANFSELVGDSAALTQVLSQVSTVATSDATVLILGETGTGKELIARAIHQMSRRKDQSFLKINCAAIPTGLLESELFGYEKGAFTHALTQKVGRMELADGGTLFLDEVGEIPLELQPKLLRALQDQEFERLGSNRTVKVNVRMIAATNRDLARSVVDHIFRADLFYRLNVFPIVVPPLRDRRDDIPLLVRYFVRKFALRMGRHIETIPTETMNALKDWSWPGNIRELENLIERSVILSEGSVLSVPISDLHSQLPSVIDSARTLDSAERDHILRVLRETNGVLSGPHGAAHRLGVKRTTLQSKMQRLKITKADYS